MLHLLSAVDCEHLTSIYSHDFAMHRIWAYCVAYVRVKTLYCTICNQNRLQKVFNRGFYVCAGGIERKSSTYL